DRGGVPEGVRPDALGKGEWLPKPGERSEGYPTRVETWRAGLRRVVRLGLPVPGAVRGKREAQLLRPFGTNVEPTGHVGPEEPFLRGDGVEVATERLHVDGDRAGRLSAVDQERDTAARELLHRKYGACQP